VEQAAAAADSMQEQSNKLAQVVSVFKLDAAQLTAHVAVAHAAPPPRVAARRPAVPLRRPASASAAVSAAPKRIAAAKAAATTAADGDWEEF
jgi:methyl-accepting chemotaxis protein